MVTAVLTALAPVTTGHPPTRARAVLDAVSLR